MNMESLVEAFLCRLGSKTNQFNQTSTHNSSGNKHFLDNPRILPCCKQAACQKCIIKQSRLDSAKRQSSGSSASSLLNSSNNHDIYKFVCPFCDQKIRFELNIHTLETSLELNESAVQQFDSSIIELNHYLVKKLDTSVKNIEERFSSKEKSLEKRKEYIKEDIKRQVDALKQHLDSLEQEMLQSLDSSCSNIQTNLSKIEQAYRNDLEEKRKLLEDLKSNAFSYAYGVKVDEKQNKNGKKKDGLNTSQQHYSVEKCMQSINQLNRVNYSISEMIDELRFDPNIDLPGKSLIGKLRKVKDVNLMEMFKTISLESQINKVTSLRSSQLMPISPRFLCIPDANNLYFTDSQTKQLIHLKLDTGDFMRATNLNGMLKNPDGLCVNSKTGHIYLGDNEQKVIFKLDSSFNVVKKISTKEVKWPRGMCYDSDNDDTKGLNCLYVCDYSSQRVAIFNSNDQLRDFMTIPPSNEYKVTKKNYEKQDQTHKKYDNQLVFEEETKFCPLNIVINKNFIYVTDDWTGGNCIRVFDKRTHTLLRNIGHLNAWSPLSLIVDDSGNIFTIGSLYYETGESHLFAFNKDGELLYKCNLNIGSDLVTDVALDKYTDKSHFKLFCAGGNRIYIFDF
jgi:DNA-binding beta-propeller fold protein YncE